MQLKTKYKFLRNLNLVVSASSLGLGYFLKRKNHGVLAIIPVISAGKFLLEAYENHTYKQTIEEDEKRIKRLTKEPIK